jgi:hypothetical protein
MRLKILGIALLAVGAIVGGGYYIYRSNDMVNESINHLYDKKLTFQDSSTEGHITRLKESIEIGKDYAKYKGVGVGSYVSYLYDHYDTNDPNRDPHSWFGKQFAEEGALGVGLYLAAYIGYVVLIGMRYKKYIVGAGGIGAVGAEHCSARTTPHARSTHTTKAFIASLLMMLIPLQFVIGMVFYYGLYVPMYWLFFGVGLYFCNQKYQKFLG